MQYNTVQYSTMHYNTKPSQLGFQGMMQYKKYCIQY